MDFMVPVTPQTALDSYEEDPLLMRSVENVEQAIADRIAADRSNILRRVEVTLDDGSAKSKELLDEATVNEVANNLFMQSSNNEEINKKIKEIRSLIQNQGVSAANVLAANTLLSDFLKNDNEAEELIQRAKLQQLILTIIPETAEEIDEKIKQEKAKLAAVEIVENFKEIEKKKPNQNPVRALPDVVEALEKKEWVQEIQREKKKLEILEMSKDFVFNNVEDTNIEAAKRQTENDLQIIEEESAKIESDIEDLMQSGYQAIGVPKNAESKKGTDIMRSNNVKSFTALDNDERAKAIEQLQKEQEKLQKNKSNFIERLNNLEHQYATTRQKIEQKRVEIIKNLELLKKKAVSANLQSDKLDHYFNKDTGIIKKEMIELHMDWNAEFLDIAREMGIKSAEDLQKNIESLEQEEKKLNAEKELHEKVQEFYEQVQKELVQLKRKAVIFGRSSAELNKFFTNNEKDTETFKPEEFTSKIHWSKTLAIIQNELGLEKTEEHQKNIAELKKQKETLRKPKTGPEAVLAIYQAYFEHHDGVGADEAYRRALELYGRNVIGKSEVQKAEDMIERGTEVTGQLKDGLITRGVYATTAPFMGGDSDFLEHLVKSPTIGMGLGRLRVPFVASHRPKWESASYPQLVTAYYAMREAVRSGKLLNTPHIRDQLGEVPRRILRKQGRMMTKDVDAHIAFLENKKEKTKEEELELTKLKNMNEREKADYVIRMMLGGEIPEKYAQSVNDALAFATAQKGRKRRSFGRNLFKGEGDWKNPITWPVRWTYHNALRGEGWKYNPITWPSRTVQSMAEGLSNVRKNAAGKIKTFSNWFFKSKHKLF